MSYYRESPETSHQGTLRMIQQDLQGHMVGTDEKIGRLQEQIELLVRGLNKSHLHSKMQEEYEEEVEYDFKENYGPGSTGKGMFRDPAHAAWERQKPWHKPVKMEDSYRTAEYNREIQSLKHLKLSFPVFKEGSDSLEWLRDCEEYFNIYEASDNRRAAIAAMHLSGTPRSWYKS